MTIDNGTLQVILYLVVLFTLVKPASSMWS